MDASIHIINKGKTPFEENVKLTCKEYEWFTCLEFQKLGVREMINIYLDGDPQFRIETMAKMANALMVHLDELRRKVANEKKEDE